MGASFVKGLQGDDPRYLKLVATAKHYAVHSGPEADRHHFDARADERDMRETYLPAFEACVREAKAVSVMGAYNRTNGEPCCASPTLLGKILRQEWGFGGPTGSEGYVVSDCWAIRDIYANHQVVETPAQAAECDEIREWLGKEQLIQITGNDALTGFTAPKILWVKNNEPQIFAQVRQILLPKDYVRFKLTGEYATDKAGGAGTVLFDVRKRDWSRVVIDALEIDPAWLPSPFEGTAVTGHITPQVAEATGLKAGTPVMGGGGDQAAGAVGTGTVVEGIVSLSLGTSGVVFASTDEPIIEPEGRLQAFCHAVPGKWHLMGVMLSAG